MRIPAILALPVVAVLAGCRSAPAPEHAEPKAQPPVLTGTWTLVEFEGQRSALAAHPPITVRIAEGRIGARVCNTLTGTISEDPDGRIRIDPPLRTKMACTQGMDLEEALVAALPKVDRAEADGRRLVLRGPDVRLVLEPAPQ